MGLGGPAKDSSPITRLVGFPPTPRLLRVVHAYREYRELVEIHQLASHPGPSILTVEKLSSKMITMITSIRSRYTHATLECEKVPSHAAN